MLNEYDVVGECPLFHGKWPVPGITVQWIDKQDLHLVDIDPKGNTRGSNDSGRYCIYLNVMDNKCRHVELREGDRVIVLRPKKI